MPVYVYRCPKCGATLELQRTVAEHEVFPMCFMEGCDGQQVMDLQLQKSALVFKGDGWTPKFGGG